MTEAAESVFFSPLKDVKVGESKCDHQQPKTGWRCVLEGKTRGGLIENLLRDRSIAEPVWPPATGSNSVEYIRKGSPGTWPHEAHHLIPWQQLRDHSVKTYLSKRARGSKLLADANYSVNHGNNGKFLPFVSDLKEWKAARAQGKQQLAERVMNKLGLQLHQGKHSSSSFGGGKKGYKARVKELLDKVRDSEVSHLTSCKACEDKAEGKKYPPREQMTRKIDRVSERLEREIDSGDVFVSRRAYLWWDDQST
jgi:hypothetical protein